MKYYFKLGLFIVMLLVSEVHVFSHELTQRNDAHCYNGLSALSASSGVQDQDNCVSPVSQIGSNIIYVKDRRSMYDAIVNAMKNHKKSISIYYPGMEKDIRKYKKNNYIELWNELQIENGYYTGIVSGYCITCSKNSDTRIDYLNVQLCYMTSKNQERYINRKVRMIAKKFKGKSRYEKIKGAHDYLTAHMKYDDAYYNPYYAFKKGRGLCMTYSLAFQRIMQEMKIPCIYVKGYNHAWNMVKIGKYWYNIDVTWDDSTGTYDYFLKGYKDFYNHRWPKKSNIKKLKRAKYSY